MATIAFYLRTYERLLIDVLALLFVLVDPQIGKHTLYLFGHQTGEYGIAGILRSCRQDAHIHVFIDIEHLAYVLGERAPLVVAEVVDDNEKHFLAVIDCREHAFLEYIGTHEGPLGCAGSHPRQIVLSNELGEGVVCLLLLHLQHLRHVRIGRTEFKFPTHKAAVYVLPVVQSVAVHDAHCYVLKLLAIAGLCHFGDNLLLVDVLFECEQNLTGIDGLDKIVGNLLSDGLIHDVLLFALGHHNYWCGGRNFLNLLQGFKSCDTRHHLVEQHKVEIALTTFLYGIVTVVDGGDVIALLLQKDNVGAQHFYLVVNPQQVSCSHVSYVF